MKTLAHRPTNGRNFYRRSAANREPSSTGLPRRAGSGAGQAESGERQAACSAGEVSQKVLACCANREAI
jgi:hypothetical protein